ncbi:Bgt-55130 [Blumeria graminis f. sp. tritici]|uniref:Bgt-55130 n=1 Tax=Blumeria graminis f. sp. tritici TaxID=62690 RepID=A0A9X9MK47_BLUGR|nr:Bgt-55130 [Blumeria graminis f. sp. tritici]
MKLFSTTSIVALAGLLQLLPTVYGVVYFQCKSGEIIDWTEISECKNLASPSYNYPSHPRVPAGETCSTYSFSRHTQDNGVKFYVFQIVGEIPIHKLYELGYTDWERCDLIIES